MSKTGLTDSDLVKAVDEMSYGLVDADLGGCLVKKRIALSGRGKSGGARTIVATRLGGNWFFLFGFKKNERANITRDELQTLQKVGGMFLALDDQQLADALNNKDIEEVDHGKS